MTALSALQAIVGWFNANQGFCMVMLTIALALCAWQSCRIATRELREQNRPHIVIAPCQVSGLYLGIALRNCGNTTAYDINFKWDGVNPISMLPKSDEQELQFLGKALPSLRGGIGYRTFLGTSLDVKKNNPTMTYRCMVSYKDSTGHRYCDEQIIDYGIFENRGIVPDEPEFEEQIVMRRIADSLNALKSEYVDRKHTERLVAGLSMRRAKVTQARGESDAEGKNATTEDAKETVT